MYVLQPSSMHCGMCAHFTKLLPEIAWSCQVHKAVKTHQYPDEPGKMEGNNCFFGNVHLHILLLWWRHCAFNGSCTEGNSLLVAIIVDKKHLSLLQNIEFSKLLCIMYSCILLLVASNFKLVPFWWLIWVWWYGSKLFQVRYPDGLSFWSLCDGDELITDILSEVDVPGFTFRTCSKTRPM